MYRQHDLRGGHVIKLGPGNDDAAKDALAAWPSKSHVFGTGPACSTSAGTDGQLAVLFIL